MSFVLSPKKEQKKKTPNLPIFSFFFFFPPDFKGGVQKRKTPIWPGFSSEHFA